jgi:L-ascorbate metabolism protein UlaG (beta-lactamase superfamily)
MGEVAFIFYKISAIALKTSRHMLLIDPADYFSAEEVRALTRLDIILFTHEHYDHFDATSAIKIQEATGAIIVCNPGAYAQLMGQVPAESLLLLEPDKTAEVKDARITAIKSVHPGKVPIMVIVDMDGLSLFHGSDSGYTNVLERYEDKAKLAFIPIGTPSPTASVNDAIKMVKALRCRIAVPIHGSGREVSAFEQRLRKEQPEVEVIVPVSLKVYKV